MTITALGPRDDPARRRAAIDRIRAYASAPRGGCWLPPAELEALVAWRGPDGYGLAPREAERMRSAYLAATPGLVLGEEEARAILRAIDAAAA